MPRIEGTSAAERIEGGVASDLIFGRGGADTVLGLAGDDFLYGGAGNDTLYGGDAIWGDRLYGGADDDILYGGDDAANTLFGGAGDDQVHVESLLALRTIDVGDGQIVNGEITAEGGAGQDTLYLPGERADYSHFGLRASLNFVTIDPIFEDYDGIVFSDGFEFFQFSDGLYSVDDIAGPFQPTVTGTAGNDRLSGLDGAKTLSGLGGDDFLRAVEGDDLLFGGAGDDTLYGSRDGSAFGIIRDVLDGGAGNDFLYSGNLLGIGDRSNEMTFRGGAGNDFLDGGGAGSFFGGDGDDEFYDRGGNGHRFGGAGNDRFFDNNMFEETGNDTYFGGAGDDFFSEWAVINPPPAPNPGGSPTFPVSRDTFYGGEGQDTFSFTAGPDIFDGGAGNDLYYVYANDTVVVESLGYSQGGGIDTVISRAAEYTLPKNVEALRLSLVDEDALVGRGNFAPEVLVGNGWDNMLYGGGGNDRIVAGEGDDRLFGGWARDTVVGQEGADTFVYLQVRDSRAGIDNRDVINGLDQGSDLIDLSAIDANWQQAGNQAYTYSSTGAFSGQAGELIWNAYGGNWSIVSADNNGDRRADFQLFVNLTPVLTEADFVL